jgi:EpsI family protein
MKKASPFIIIIILLSLALFARQWIENQQNLASEMKIIPFEQDLGKWKGTDLKLEADVVEMLNPDQIVFRRYQNPTGGSVDLYGAFYGAQGAGRTMHSPLNCYPGTGWEIVGKSTVHLNGPGDDKNGFEVRKLILRKGLTKRLLYYWYYAGGKTASNQYMNKALTLYGALMHGRTDGGLVTVSTIQDDAGLNQENLEKDFVPLLLEYLSKQPISH